MKERPNKQKKNKKWYFLFVIFSIYVITAFLNFEIFIKSLDFLKEIVFQLIPIFVIVYILMVIVDKFISSDFINTHMSKDAGIKAWIIMIVSGIISTGPIYAWYPFLSNLQKKGVSDGLLATFLYNRSIKIQFFPVLLTYFSPAYVFILTFLMIFFSIIQGIWIDMFVKNIDKKE